MSYGAPQTFATSSISKRPTTLRSRFIHVIEGHHPLSPFWRITADPPRGGHYIKTQQLDKTHTDTTDFTTFLQHFYGAFMTRPSQFVILCASPGERG